MPGREVHAYPSVETVVGSIANWVSQYRRKFGVAGAFGYCTPEEVMMTARDIGLPERDLRALAAKGPHAADRLRKMLLALRVDPDALNAGDPATMRDLQRLCATCSHKRRCDREFAHGTAAGNFREFCPNAYTLDALFEQDKAASAAH